jgi:hypothetical protein
VDWEARFLELKELCLKHWSQTPVGDDCGDADAQSKCHCLSELEADIAKEKARAGGDVPLPFEDKLRSLSAKVDSLEAKHAASKLFASAEGPSTTLYEPRFHAIESNIERLHTRHAVLVREADARMVSVLKRIDALPGNTKDCHQAPGMSIEVRKAQIIDGRTADERLANAQDIERHVAKQRAELEEVQSLLAEQLEGIHKFATEDVSYLEDKLRRTVGTTSILVSIQNVSGLRVNSARLCCIGEIVGKPDSEFQTKVVEGKQSPMWDEIYELKEFGIRDSLQIRLYDRQEWPMRDIVLGDVCLTGHDIYSTDFLQGAYKLANGLPGLELHVKVRRLDPKFDSHELRQVAVHCNGVRATVEKIQNRMQAQDGDELAALRPRALEESRPGVDLWA